MMVRDGRDVAVSEVKRLGNFEAAVHSWRIHNNSALRFYSDPRVHVVKYEELVAISKRRCAASASSSISSSTRRC